MNSPESILLKLNLHIKKVQKNLETVYYSHIDVSCEYFVENLKNIGEI